VFKDLVRGEIRFHTDVIGDQVLLRSDGYPAYNFGVVVDDGLMGVTHVVRGEDHISNTPRQILLYEALGFALPEFGHVAMVLGPDHTKLSKRHGAVSVDQFREKGYLPEALLNYLALLSWSPGEGEELVPLAEMAKRFSLSDVGHSASVFDEEKLAWVNRHYLKEAEVGRLTTLSMPYLRRAGYVTGELGPEGAAFLASLVPIFNTSVDRLDQVPQRLRQLFEFSPAAALGDAFDGGGAGLRVADVDLQRRDLPTFGGSGGDDRVGRGGVVAVEERHVRTLGGEELDDRAADAAAAAGHDDGLAGDACVQFHAARLPDQPEIAKPPSTTSVCPWIIEASGRQRR